MDIEYPHIELFSRKYKNCDNFKFYYTMDNNRDNF